MKLLIVGIDGGDERILRGMTMPNLQRHLDSGRGFRLVDDLWSRGWAEVLCGKHGRDCGAFYTKPVIGATGQFTQSFKATNYAANANLKPLWQLTTERGLSLGMMNVPTTMPAPQFDGFCVAGAGSGFGGSGSAEIPAAAAHPASVRDQLLSLGYIFDTRFRASGIRAWEPFLTQLTTMQRKRTEVFLAQCRQHAPDIGFVTYVSTTRIQYLAMSEIELILQHGVQTERQQQIADLYHDFDQTLDDLITILQPTFLLFVSDHGASPYRYNVNVHPFLREMGYLGKPMQSRSFIRSIGRLLPLSVKRRMTKRAPQTVKSLRAPNINWQAAQAFGSRYIPGIYLNDDRFGGVVKDGDQLVGEIIGRFNAHPTAQQHNLHARPYRQQFPTAQHNDLLPDIWIDHDDNYFFTARGEFVSANADYGAVTSLADVPRDQFTGIKGRNPLLFTNAPVTTSEPNDLTLAYRLIEQIIHL